MYAGSRGREKKTKGSYLHRSKRTVPGATTDRPKNLTELKTVAPIQTCANNTIVYSSGRPGPLAVGGIARAGFPATQVLSYRVMFSSCCVHATVYRHCVFLLSFYLVSLTVAASLQLSVTQQLVEWAMLLQQKLLPVRVHILYGRAATTVLGVTGRQILLLDGLLMAAVVMM